MSNWGRAGDLRAWRKGRRLTQTEVATALKMTRGGYANYEAGSAPIPERRMDALRAMGFGSSDSSQGAGVTRAAERNAAPASPRLILSLINSIAHPDTPAQVRQQLAQELIDLLRAGGQADETP